MDENQSEFPDMEVVELSEEEYERFQEYKEKMKKAESLAEMRYCYSQMKIIMDKAIERKKQQEQ
ncbi:hypothetical protein [Bacillus sp. BML-BC060]|uniref:hypothetical protein n=1 Tax=Bacillus sp. BML-BC060 TaxID=2842487 RepID=UPI001C7FD787|nr:hypothetical protein [Bacillus sp. BML-BC060]